MTKEQDHETATTEELLGALKIAAGNVLRGAAPSPMFVAGLLLSAAMRLGELLDSRAALMRSVAKGIAITVPAAEEPDADDAPPEPKHRHKFEGEPPVCACGKEKGRGGRPPKAAAPTAEEGTLPMPLAEPAPAAAAAAAPAGYSEGKPVGGEAAADKFSAGPV